MKTKYKYLIILILMQFILTSCVMQKNTDVRIGGPQSNEGGCVNFGTLSELKRIFAKMMAYPTYYPYEIDKVEGVRFSGLAYPEKKYLNLSTEEFKKRLDIYTHISVNYRFYSGEGIGKDDEPYKLSSFALSCVLKDKEKGNIVKKPSILYETETLEYKGFKIDYIEKIYSKIFDNSIDSNKILSEYHMEFDKKRYNFVFLFEISENVVSKEELFKLRDKLKQNALEEVIKSYNSLKYENQD